MNNNQIQHNSTVQGMVMSRQAQEVQAAMVVAKRFPRDEQQSENKIINACSRIGLAEQATYEYPRGGTRVTGPSIRLAEALARGWGNIDYGIIELEQKDGKSEMMAYAWDLENNTRVTRVFAVEHARDTKRGSKKLTSSRDIYEMTANMGARRVRACILEVIPGDIVDTALKQCETTLKGNNDVPLEERVKEMVNVFEKEFGVTKEMLEEKIGCNVEAFSENNVLSLKAVYRSLKDGMAGVEDYFPKEEKEVEESPYTKKDNTGKSDEEFADELDEKLKAEDEENETD